MSGQFAISAATVFDGEAGHNRSAVVVDGGTISSVSKIDDIPPGCKTIELPGGMLAPAFVDLQVNGGGGVLFNDHPDLSAINAICKAHAQFGTAALLPTLITDTPETMARAIEAGVEARKRRLPGFLGLHLEGPFLSVDKSGAHDPTLIRKMDSDDLDLLVRAAGELDHLMITVAPEAVTLEQISAMDEAGIVVSLGHSPATFRQVSDAVSAGARCVTHLFNAMSQLGHREPGMIGGALRHGEVSAGLVADGHHVNPVAISIALAAKNGPGRIFLVTDAMSTVGADQTEFTLNGRTIRREGGRLTLEDGTLAGADLDMNSAIRFMVDTIGLEPYEAIRMASAYPSRCIGAGNMLGMLKPGYRANIVHFDDDLDVCGCWIEGRKVD